MKRRTQPLSLTGKSLFFAIVVHLAIAAVLLLNINWSTQVASAKRSPPVLAKVIEETDVQQQLDRIQKKEEEKKQKELEAKQELERKKKEQELEQKRLAELERQKKEEQKRQQELKKKQEEERIKQAALEKKKLEEQKKAEEEKRRKEEERKKQEAEKKRKEEEERQRKLAEEQQRKRELAERLEAERIERQVNLALSEYVPIIQQKVSRNWNQPSSLQSNIEAHVNVRLTKNGDVVSAKVVKSSGNSVFDRSVENAVHKASPLPIPQERGVNDKFRNLTLRFRPEDLIS